MTRAQRSTIRCGFAAAVYFVIFWGLAIPLFGRPAYTPSVVLLCTVSFFLALYTWMMGAKNEEKEHHALTVYFLLCGAFTITGYGVVAWNPLFTMAINVMITYPLADALSHRFKRSWPGAREWLLGK